MNIINKIFVNYADDALMKTSKFLSECNRVNQTTYSTILQIKPKELTIMQMKSPICEDLISFNTIKSKSFDSKIDSLLPTDVTSTTLKRIFTSEFKSARRIDENGYMVTTILDKTTNKPVEVFIKEVNAGDFNFYRKIQGVYENIGRRSFCVDKDLKVIRPGFMSSYYNDKYAGIGIRGHQLAVESLMKENLDVIYLSSLPKAKNFHIKNLYKPLYTMKVYDKTLNEFIEDLANNLSLSFDEASKLITCVKKDNFFEFDIKKTTQAINGYFKKYGISEHLESNMDQYVLDGEALALWKEMAATQPILL